MYTSKAPSQLRTLWVSPFGRAAGKMFALLMLGRDDGPAIVNLKCDPDRALLLRASFPAIKPGYHANKVHGNTLVLDGSLPASLVTELIDHSYDLVAGGRTKSRPGSRARPSKGR